MRSTGGGRLETDGVSRLSQMPVDRITNADAMAVRSRRRPRGRGPAQRWWSLKRTLPRSSEPVAVLTLEELLALGAVSDLRMPLRVDVEILDV